MQEAKEVPEEELPYIRWSTYDVTKHQVEYLMEEDENLDEDKAWDMAQGDPFVYESEWDYVLESLEEKMTEYNPDGHKWHARVENFGWRNLDGQKAFYAKGPKEFLCSVLPDTDNTFNIYVDDDLKQIRIQNWHHDSPMGNEWYTIEVCEDDENE